MYLHLLSVPKSTLKTEKIMNESQVKSAKPKASGVNDLGDSQCPGLRLLVRAGKKKVTKTWYLRYTRGQKTTKCTLGQYPTMGLAQARKIARDLTHAQRYENIDPKEHLRALRKPKQAITVAMALDNYLTLKEPILRPNTLTQYKYLANHLIKPKIGDRDIQALTRADATEFMSSVMSTPMAARNCMVLLRACFNQCLDMGQIEANCWSRLQIMRQLSVGIRERTLTDLEIQMVMKWGDQENIPYNTVACFLFNLCLGLRPNEGLKLTYGEVHREEGYILLAGARVKTKKSRKIPLPQFGEGILDKMLEQHLDDPKPSDLVFFNKRKDNHFDTGLFNKFMQRNQTRTDYFVPYDARRSCGTRLAEWFPRDTVGLVLGHADQSVTAVHYIHSDGWDRQGGAALLSGEATQLYYQTRRRAFSTQNRCRQTIPLDTGQACEKT